MRIASLALLLPMVVVASIAIVLRAHIGRRAALIVGCVVTGMLVVLITELLSLGRALTPMPLASAWLLAAGCAVAWALRAPRAAPAPVGWRRLRLDEAFVLAPAIIFPALTLSVALVAPPNTGDSLSYHLARVAHWAQNQGVAPYPTHILRQLHQTPFSEFAILHAQVLTGGDGYANLVQWSAVLVSALAASLIAKHLRCGLRGQLLAALLVVTVPMAVAQATSTQNDAVTGLWVIAFVALAGLPRTGPDPTPRLVILGGALGLAALTKATAYVIAFPFVVGFIVSRRRDDLRALSRTLGIVFGVALALNFGFYVRNTVVEGSPLGPGSEIDGRFVYSNEAHGPRVVVSNVVRNLALHMGMPSHAVNVKIQAALEGGLRAAGIDPNDPRTTWPGTHFSVGTCFDDGCAENPFHLFLAVLSFGAVLVTWYRTRASPDRGIALCVIAGFVLFCALLKFQPWHSRLHLPFFILAAPVIAMVIDRALRARGTVLVTTLLIIGALPPLYFEATRPFLDGFGRRSVFRVTREQSYVQGNPALLVPVQRVADGIAASRCDQVGLLTGGNSPEYTVWAFTAMRLPELPRFQHVGVTNASGRLAGRPPYSEFEPCAVVTYDVSAGPALDLDGARFVRTDTVVASPQLYLRVGRP